MKPVLVTGGTGFVASHLVARLLDEGYEVRATVRSLTNAAKVAPLRALAAGRPGSLTLFEADLLTPGAFDEAMEGCETVFHVASPFLVPEQITDGEREVLEPARLGTQHVVAAIEATPSVRRMVMTSTVGAIFGDYADVPAQMGGVLREEFVNTTSTLENNPYHYAKTVAEQLAWDLNARQDRWSLVTINPGLVLGPAIAGPSSSGSLFLLDELLRGEFWYGAPNFAFTVVDVRDVATAHLRAAQRPQAHGRYILARPEMVSFLDMGRIVRRDQPLRLRVPVLPVPDAAVRILGPHFGLTQEYIRNHLGIRFTVDNRRSVDELGITYRPVAETVLAHDAAWRARR